MEDGNRAYSEGGRIEVVLETVVRCTEIDVNGHVNNAKFVEYLEWGREEWYDSHGFAYDRLRGLGAITVVVNINLNLRRACRQGDRLRIITRPERRGRTSFAFAQRIEQMDGAVAADATVTLVTIDPNTRRSRPLPEEFGRLFPAPAGIHWQAGQDIGAAGVTSGFQAATGTETCRGSFPESRPVAQQKQHPTFRSTQWESAFRGRIQLPVSGFVSRRLIRSRPVYRRAVRCFGPKRRSKLGVTGTGTCA